MNEDGVREREEPSLTVRFLVWVTVEVGAITEVGVVGANARLDRAWWMVHLLLDALDL